MGARSLWRARGWRVCLLKKAHVCEHVVVLCGRAMWVFVCAGAGVTDVAILLSGPRAVHGRGRRGGAMADVLEVMRDEAPLHSWRMLGSRPMCIRYMRVDLSAAMALNQVYRPCLRACNSSVVAHLALRTRGHMVRVQATTGGQALAYCLRCAAYAQNALGTLGLPWRGAVRPDQRCRARRVGKGFHPETSGARAHVMLLGLAEDPSAICALVAEAGRVLAAASMADTQAQANAGVAAARCAICAGVGLPATADALDGVAEQMRRVRRRVGPLADGWTGHRGAPGGGGRRERRRGR